MFKTYSVQAHVKATTLAFVLTSDVELNHDMARRILGVLYPMLYAFIDEVEVEEIPTK